MASAVFDDLNAMQANGHACIVDGVDFTTSRTPHVPVGYSATTGSQVFACAPPRPCAPAVGYVPSAGDQLATGQCLMSDTDAELERLRAENRRLHEERVQRTMAAERDVCSGCMQREQQRDQWAETSRQNGVKYEQMKQAFYREQDRARAAEAERDEAQLATGMAIAKYSAAKERAGKAEGGRDRLRLAWQSARDRAKAYGESMTRLSGAWGSAEGERDALQAHLARIVTELEAERDKTREAEGATGRDENVINGIVNGLGIALRIARGER